MVGAPRDAHDAPLLAQRRGHGPVLQQSWVGAIAGRGMRLGRLLCVCLCVSVRVRESVCVCMWVCMCGCVWLYVVVWLCVHVVVITSLGTGALGVRRVPAVADPPRMNTMNTHLHNRS